jgi:hypothetical protein
MSENVGFVSLVGAGVFDEEEIIFCPILPMMSPTTSVIPISKAVE